MISDDFDRIHQTKKDKWETEIVFGIKICYKYLVYKNYLKNLIKGESYGII